MIPRVRPARPDDLAALVGLWRELERLHGLIAPSFFRPGERPDDWRPLELSAAALAGTPSELRLVAESTAGTELLGALSAALRDTPRSASLTPVRRLHVETLVVAAGSRRLGVGRLLMAEAEAWARRQGAAQVVLTVWRGNEAAEGFYRALGYGTVSQVLACDL